MSPAMRRGLVIFGAGLAILVAALLVQLWTTRPNEGPTLGVSIGGPFSLTDQTGKKRRDAEFRGKLMLVYFGYAYCPDVCPTELQAMSEALEQLGPKASEVQPIFITVDPERDTPELLTNYAQNFDSRFLMLTGSDAQIAEAARGYKVYYKRTVKSDGEVQVDHSSFVYLMGKDGRYLAHFSPGTTPEQMAAAIAKRL
jgi:cytochrome oxidase Cu insertion factor (SCO1/SenC/PrrC family)